jgi:isopenicillin N synthase-like dioxygenase
VPVQPRGTENDPFPPILVNIGDLLDHWTGGLLKSTVHRVVFGGESNEQASEERYSIAYFFHPCAEEKLVAVPSEMVRERVERLNGGGNGKVLTASEHLKGRLAATYGWGMEEEVATE